MQRRYLVSDMTFSELCQFLSDFDYRFYEVVILTVSQVGVSSDLPIDSQRFSIEYKVIGR